MSYELISRTEPKARKPYVCIWCNDPIVKGDKYVHEVSKYEGNLQDHHWHPECESAGRRYFSESEEFDPGSFERGHICGKLYRK